ncbi:MAG: hypothetical protein UX74_C0017G0010 [Parcubacteria group bacterium GW2011_GWA2_47_10b]|nr:MAG: hypothetical protein UX74_C0017G0010 [Parcubacteria group bacterium GW2011_GWA2_47_10b]
MSKEDSLLFNLYNKVIILYKHYYIFSSQGNIISYFALKIVITGLPIINRESIMPETPSIHLFPNI